MLPDPAIVPLSGPLVASCAVPLPPMVTFALDAGKARLDDQP